MQYQYLMIKKILKIIKLIIFKLNSNIIHKFMMQKQMIIKLKFNKHKYINNKVLTINKVILIYKFKMKILMLFLQAMELVSLMINLSNKLFK